MKKLVIFIVLFCGLNASIFAQCPIDGGDEGGGPTGGAAPIPDPNPHGGGEIDVTQPVDPNEIIGPTGYDVAGTIDLMRWLSATQRLSYTVYFENDPELATAAAQRVEVRHKLHGKANYASFELGDFGFSNQVFTVTGNPVSYQTRLDLRDSMGLYVDVVAGIDVVHNEAFWIFQTIDPLTGLPPLGANEGFLPINDSTHRGEGYVTFSIVPNTALCHTGDTITATASIVFDVNNAIATNTWVNTIDAAAPTSTLQVEPNATYDSMLVAFSGSDDADGSGIKQYRLYVSANGGGYQPAGVFAEGEEARVPVTAGVQYRYVSLAEDNVGNIEPMKGDGDTAIGVSQLPIYAIPMPADGGVIAGAGVVEQGDTVTLTATANEGYHFARWAEQGVTVDNNAQYSFAAEQSHTLTAMFERDAYHLWVQEAEGATVTVTDNGGNAILPGASIYHGDTLQIAVQTTQCVTLNGLTINGQTFTQTVAWIVTNDVTVVAATMSVAVDTLFYTDAVCVGDDYSGYGFNILSSATSEVDTLTFTAQVLNDVGCPRVAQLTLMVKPYLTITFDPNGGTGTMGPQTICANELGLLTGSEYQSGSSSSSAALKSNEFTKSGENFEGWALSPTGSIAYTDGDVIITNTDITLYAQWTTNCVNAYSTDLQIVCDSFIWRGNTYTQSGIYSDTVTSVVLGGCDSVYTLHLTVNNTSYYTDTVTACDRYVWIDDQPYTENNFNSQFSIPNSSGCDSIITLNLTILHSDTVYDQQTACNSLTWIDGRTYTESNHTAFLALQNVTGCDSIVRLSLDIQSRWSVSFNANGGVGDMPAQRFCTDEPGVLSNNHFTREGYQFDGWALTPEASSAQYQDNDTVALSDNVILYAKWKPNCHDEYGLVRSTVCDHYVWGEKEYTVSGVYIDTVKGVVPGMCDSIYTFDLTIKHRTFGTDTHTECPGYEWMNGRVYYTDNNTSIYRLTNAVGCDSLVTLNLTILPERTITFEPNGGLGIMPTQAVCSGNDVLLQSNKFIREGYYFAGWAFSENGSALFTDGDVINLTSDSTLYAVWSLTCVPNYSTSLVHACDEYLWRSKSLTTSGVYRDTIISGQTCDSIYVLYLTVNASSSTIETREACESFVWWNGQQYTESTTTPTYVMTNRGGCDSTLTLHLTINHSSSFVETVTACDSYLWNGATYTASTDEPILYTTNATGCDSTVALHLTVNYSSSAVETVVSCDNYTWHGATYTNSTNAPTYTTTNAQGCDSTITLHLTITESLSTTESITACDSYTWHGVTYTASTNTPTYSTTTTGGCDSTVTLLLTINNSTTATEAITACDSYTWHGTAYTASTNTPTYSTLNSASCDSTVTLHLTINNSTSAIETITACDSYTWHDSTYTTSTLNSQFSTLNSVGCDSTVTLHLTINNSTSSTESITACDSYTWHGTAYTASTNTPTYLTTNATGCDSTVTLHLTINNSTTSTENVTACDSYTWHGTAYTTSTNTPTYTTNNTVGCDSTITLHLTINNSTSSTESITACDSYTWHDSTFTTSTFNFQFSTFNSQGCDSTVTLHLTINYSQSAAITAAICEGEYYPFNGNSLTTAGYYTDTLLTSQGCDSVLTLTLTVNPVSEITLTESACDSYTWIDGTTYTTSTNEPTFTTLNQYGCDSTVTLHLTINYSTRDTVVDTGVNQYEWQGNTYTESGEYVFEGQTEAGCDSIIVLQLTITNVGISTIDNIGNINLYPNPTTGKVTIDADGVAKVEVFDQNGRIAATFLDTNVIDIHHLPTGAYTLRITLHEGTTVKRLIKQ